MKIKFIGYQKGMQLKIGRECAAIEVDDDFPAKVNDC